MGNKVLEFDHVNFSYKEKQEEPIISDLSFHISKGEFVSLIGPSGSGKSTIFRLISGLEEPKKGEIKINEKKVTTRLGKVGYMPQQDLLMPWRTILANAALPLEVKGIKKEKAHLEVKELLGEFGLEGVEEKYPHELSGGMKQRVSFLRSILSGSDILLLDEPFSALDAITRISMQEWLLEQWKKWNRTILFITHDVDEALFLSDRILALSQKPISQLKELHVPIPRPRSIYDLSQRDIVLMKQQLINDLRVGII